MSRLSRQMIRAAFTASILLLAAPVWADPPWLPGRPGTTVADGTWIPLPPPDARGGHDGVYDPVRRRMLVFGGTTDITDITDVWELNLDGPPKWRLVRPAGTPPSARSHHRTIYDPHRDRVVLYGGGLPTSGETWGLTLSGTPAWQRIVTASTPENLWLHSAIYDPVRDRMIVFGGQGSSSDALNDIWALDLSGASDWTELTPSGTPPDPRWLHSAMYDPVRDRMIVFGGFSFASGYLEDAWALDLGSLEWAELAPSGPGPHFEHSASYDPIGDRMLVFGGGASAFPPPHPMHFGWSLSLSGTPAWSTQLCGGAAPAPRGDQAVIYDPVGERLVVFGGAAPNERFNDTWTLSLATGPWWVQLNTNTLSASGHGAVHDPVRGHMVVVGFDSQVWTYALGTGAWTHVVPSGSGPPPLIWNPPNFPDDRPDFSLIYDSTRERVILYGGGTRSGAWALSLTGAPAWSSLAPIGGPPAARSNHSAIYDSLRDRMLVFGGQSASGFHNNELWQLGLAGTPTWTLLAPAGTLPPIRGKHTAILDAGRDRMVIYGGIGAVSGGSYAATDNLDDAWAIDLSGPLAWTPLSPGAVPPRRSDHTAIYDPVRERMVVHGGVYRDFYLVRTTTIWDDVWALSLVGPPAWTRLAPAGPPASPRFGHSAFYEPGRDRMVVFGGEGNFLSDDAIALAFTDATTAVAISLIAAHATSSAVRLEWHSALGGHATLVRRSESEPWRELVFLSPDGDGRYAYEDRDIVPGRRYGYVLKVGSRDPSAETWIDVPLGTELALTGLIPNPSRGRPLAVAFTLPDARPARIELIDASGRRVMRRPITLQAGRHVVPIAPDGALAPGIYFLRLSQGAERRTRRCSVIE